MVVVLRTTKLRKLYVTGIAIGDRYSVLRKASTIEMREAFQAGMKALISPMVAATIRQVSTTGG